MNTNKDFEALEILYSCELNFDKLDRIAAALLYNNRGHSRYMQVKFDEAVEDYNRSIELNPRLPVAYYNRGTVLYRMGAFDTATADMEQAVKLEPQNSEFREGLRDCLKKLNQQKQYPQLTIE